MKRVCVIGGVAGGASAAARLRRLCEKCSIKVFEKGAYASFANCGLPYRVGQVITDDAKLLVATPQLFKDRFNIDVLTGHEVVKIDRSTKTLKIRKVLTGEEFEEPYDKLVLAPGAGAIRPNLPGIDLDGIFSLRTIPDMQQVMAHINKVHRPGAAKRKALVVGGGFIGLETAENLVLRGLDVTVLELSDHVMPMLSADLANVVQQHLTKNGVTIRTREGVESFEYSEDGEHSLRATTNLGNVLEADIVIMAIGVRPDTRLAVQAGLALGARGSIKVDSTMATSDPDILAVGDAVESTDFLTGEKTNVPLAGPANRMGRTAADTIMQHPTPFRGVQATAVCGLFGLVIASTGATEQSLCRAGITNYHVVDTHPGHHVTYFPGAKQMHLKMLFSKEDGRVLGVQGVGESGVERRVDVIAMAIQMRATVRDLQHVELCYAPQFGAAKDPINMLGFVGTNVLEGHMPLASWDKIPVPSDPDTPFTPSEERPMILDVRMPIEYKMQHIPGAVNVPMEELRARIHEIPKDVPVYVCCQVGQRAYTSLCMLTANGVNAHNITGGITSWCLRHNLVPKPLLPK